MGEGGSGDNYLIILWILYLFILIDIFIKIVYRTNPYHAFEWQKLQIISKPNAISHSTLLLLSALAYGGAQVPEQLWKYKEVVGNAIEVATESAWKTMGMQMKCKDFHRSCNNKCQDKYGNAEKVQRNAIGVAMENAWTIKVLLGSFSWWRRPQRPHKDFAKKL